MATKTPTVASLDRRLDRIEEVVVRLGDETLIGTHGPDSVNYKAWRDFLDDLWAPAEPPAAPELT